MIRTSKVAELVSFDIDDSGIRAATAFRGSYLRIVEKHDGLRASQELEEHFQSHPLDDPYAFAMRMRGNTILGVYADSDGTLIDKRDGYDANSLFSPRLAASISKTIERTGLFTIASAAHIKRALVLLSKARNQVPLERTLFFAENGYAAIIPLKNESSYEFEIHKAVMPKFVTIWNQKMRVALDTLSNVALDFGLFMFVNQDKQAKITLELMKNDKKANTEIVDKLVVPYLVKELRFERCALGVRTPEQLPELPSLTYTFTPTLNSIEIDHSYLPSKRTVNTISNDLARLIWFKAFGDLWEMEGSRVFVGFGDSPRGSDAGLVDPLRGNIGFHVRDQSRTLEPNDSLLEAIRSAANPPSPFVSLPAFSQDGTVQYGDGESVAESLNRLFFTGAVFRITDLDVMRSSLRTVLGEARYVRDQADADELAKNEMYTLPTYLSERHEAENLMKHFLNSDIADTEITRKVSAIASQVGIG